MPGWSQGGGSAPPPLATPLDGTSLFINIELRALTITHVLLVCDPLLDGLDLLPVLRGVLNTAPWSNSSYA